ncbi:hypothetical protein SUGI_0787280 [Cryptomeria japonica]|nr:hypothetical protein SUGI_0787280 [Cryptomeria japonica]
MAASGFSSSEWTSSQAAVGNFCSHPAAHVGSEAEHVPHCGNGVGGGRANQFADGGRRSCKRKIFEGISGHSAYDGPSHSFSRQRNSLTSFTVPARHEIGSVSSFSTPAGTPASAQHREDPGMPRPGLMGGSGMAPGYRSNALSVIGTIDGPQRSVRNRSNQTFHEEQNLPYLRLPGNYTRHVHPRSSPAEQSNMDRTNINSSIILHEQCHFPTSSQFERSIVPNNQNENMSSIGSQFTFNATGRERPSSLHMEVSSSSMISAVPNQAWPVSGADRRTSNNNSSSWAPVTRNLNGVPYTDQMFNNPILSSRAPVPQHLPQNLHMQVPRANSGFAQGLMSSSRSGPSNHHVRATGAISFNPVNMVINHETGSQVPHYFNSSWMEHNGSRNGRPLTRSILDIPLERFQALQNENERHNRMIPEDVLLFDQSAFYGAIDLHDQHRDMRLDVDNMTYEELLALEERIGNVNTGITEESTLKCLKIRTYSSSKKLSDPDETSQKCSICQEEYEDDEELGTLECGHDHHTECIKKWLLQKNECPICKASALKA